MIKIGFVREALTLSNLPEEVKEEVLRISRILDEEYDDARDMYADMGGYIIIIESVGDISLVEDMIHIDLINDAIPEYVGAI